MKKQILSLLLLPLCFACSEEMPTDASSLADETKTILNDAKFSYHTKFNKFHHYHDFLSSPRWNDFFVLVDNDTVLSLAIPFEDVGKVTRSYLVANRLKANDSLFYYVQIVKKKKSGRARSASRDNSLLYVIEPNRLFRGRMEGDHFIRTEQLPAPPNLNYLRDDLQDCQAKCHEDIDMDEDEDGILDGGELEGITVTPDEPYYPDYPDIIYWDDPWWYDWPWWYDYYPGGGVIIDPGDGSTDETPSFPNSDGIINNTSQLTEEQKELLEEAIKTARAQNCYIDAIYNYLSGENYNFDFVSVGSEAGGAAATATYRDANNNITRKDLLFYNEECIGWQSFGHELTHLFQYQQGENTNTDMRGMMEYERALVDDILFMAQFKGDMGAVPPEEWYRKPYLLLYDDKSNIQDKKVWEQVKKEYRAWHNKITKDGIPSSISYTDFMKWVSLFAEGDRRYGEDKGYQYENIEYQPVSLNKILEIAKENCE